MTATRHSRRARLLLVGLAVSLGLLARMPVMLWHDHEEHAHVELSVVGHGEHADHHAHVEDHHHHHGRHAGSPHRRHEHSAPSDQATASDTGPQWADGSHHHHDLTADDFVLASPLTGKVPTTSALAALTLPVCNSRDIIESRRPRPPRDRPSPRADHTIARHTVFLI